MLFTRLFSIYMRKPFGSRFGQLVSKFRIVIFLSGLAFTICTNPSHLQRESGTGIKNGFDEMEHEFPFGNSVWEFWSTFQEYFPFGKTKLVLPFKFQPKFPDFFVNGKQPQCLDFPCLTSNVCARQFSCVLLRALP